MIKKLCRMKDYFYIKNSYNKKEFSLRLKFRKNLKDYSKKFYEIF